MSYQLFSLVQPLSFADLDTFGCCTDMGPDDFLCTVDEVQHLIETLDIAKSTSSDGIAAKMLKSVAQSIAPSVTELMNPSIQSGCFPVTWKLSIQFLNLVKGQIRAIIDQFLYFQF